MRENSFVIEFLKHPLEIGTFSESSRYLVNGIVKKIKGLKIVELGAGRGPVTKGILKKLPQNGKLISFENNPKLYSSLLYIKDSRFTPVLTSAENFEKFTKDIDCIISGLPLSTLDKEICDNILKNSAKYPIFIQYKYFNSKKILKKYFKEIKVKRVYRNFPPALVYVCHN